MWKLYALLAVGFALATLAGIIDYVGVGIIGGALMGMSLTLLLTLRDVRSRR